MKHLLDLKVINKFISVSNNELRLTAVSNLAVAVLSTLGVLCKFREAIELIKGLKDLMEYFKQDHLKFELMHANFLYQAHKIQLLDPEQNNRG